MNQWLFLYFIYAGASVLWSEHTFLSLKQWVKDTGNVVMVLIILSEPNPTAAIKTVLLRCSYILVTLTLMFFKYFPEAGRVYDPVNGRPVFIGVSTNKNGLGAALLVCAIVTLWSVFEEWKRTDRDKRSIMNHSLIIAVTFWLLLKSHSATSLACAVLAAMLFFAIRLPAGRYLIQRSGATILFVAPAVILLLNFIFDLGQLFVSLLGRDLTFTSRTLIWAGCLDSNINPLIGAGYCDFWKQDFARIISQHIGFFYILKEAHNGYLETYLNGGLIGLALLLAAMVAGARRIFQQLEVGSGVVELQVAVLVVALVYNLTESAFNGLNQIWFIMLFAITQYPYHRPVPGCRQSRESRERGNAPAFAPLRAHV